MQCPQCGARTEVNEKRGPFRDRRCTNPACRLDVTTCEQLLTRGEGARLCARTRATQSDEQRESQPPDEAISGAQTDRPIG